MVSAKRELEEMKKRWYFVEAIKEDKGSNQVHLRRGRM